jgi:hypothetical protein
VANSERRGLTTLSVTTGVLPTAVGVAINLATDGKHSWWAWVAVGGVAVISVVVALCLARQTQNPPPPHNEQNITASGSGATAQGAMFGNVINHASPPDPSGATAASKPVGDP